MISEILSEFDRKDCQPTEPEILRAVRRAKIRQGKDRADGVFFSAHSYAAEAVEHIMRRNLPFRACF